MKNGSNLTFLCSGGSKGCLSIVLSYNHRKKSRCFWLQTYFGTLCTCIICVSKDSLASLLKCVLISRGPVFKNGCILRDAGTVMD